MNWTEIALIASLLGLGGVAGALISTVSSAARVLDSYENLSSTFRNYLSENRDPGVGPLAVALNEFENEVSTFRLALNRLKKVLRIR